MLYLLTLFPIVCVALMLRVIIIEPTNYTDADLFYFFLWPLCFCVILSFFLYKFKKEKKRQFLVSFGTSIVAILFFLFVDRFNIMIQYDDWLHRGMPSPFEPSRIVEREYPRELGVRYLEYSKKLKDGTISREEYDRENALINIEIKKYKEQKKAKENDRN
jgi:glucan phosphoethanolaminetransferase (alkaline phosphatase superfamily)